VSGCCRENASSLFVNVAARCAPLHCVLQTPLQLNVGLCKLAQGTFKVAYDDGQEVIKVVRDTTGQVADGFQLLRLT
jgi:hypothetical protein